MALTYAEFKDFVTTFLWRTGDQLVVDNLDTLIRLAEVRLDRDLRVEDRHIVAPIQATSLDLPLPDDYKQMRAVMSQDENLPPFTYATPVEILRMRTQHPNHWRPFYSINGTSLMLVGKIDASNYIDVYVDYLKRIPDFKGTDASWLTDDYIDIYVYAALMHATPFVREDERVGQWQSTYDILLDGIIQENEFYKKRGVPSTKPLPRAAGINRRGRKYQGKWVY